MRHSVRAALDPVDPFANKMGWSIDFHHRLLGTEGKVLKDSATHIAQILRDRGVEHPAAPSPAQLTVGLPTWFGQPASENDRTRADD